MLRRSAITLSLVSLAIVGCNRSDPKLAFSAHWRNPLPSSAKLLNSGAQYAGIDASYGFVFEVTDDVLQDQLIASWQLEPSTAVDGFFKFANHPWWPSADEFAKMDEVFVREDQVEEEYWLVWRDRSSNRLYVEHGKW